MKKVLLFSIFILSLVAFVAIFLILTAPGKKLTQAEKERVLTNLLGRKPILNEKEAPKGNVEYKGKTVSFLYPAAGSKFVTKVNGQVQNDNWNLDNFNYDVTNPHTTILVTVSQAATGVTSISDYPGVKLRLTQSGIYKEEDILVDNHSGLSFYRQDNSGSEKTAFFYISGRIYIFSIAGTDSNAVMDVFNTVVLSSKFL